MENARFPDLAEPSAPNSANSTSANVGLTARQSRVLLALLETDAWIPREAVDRIAGASNGPQIILELRRKVTGHEGIQMEKADAQDRDGRPCKPGRYKLNPIGRERTAQYLGLKPEGAA